ncbi:unnamed protein product [Caenorhabditis nigoni]
MKTIALTFCCFLSLCTALPTKICGENEQLVSCHNTCEPLCGFSPQICTMQCIINTCDCKRGYVRNALGKCVTVFDCTRATTKCPENETFHECGSACEPSCANPNPEICTEQCIINTCQCATGFVRHGFNCVSPSECPPRGI